jgi:competence protein ComEC
LRQKRFFFTSFEESAVDRIRVTSNLFPDVQYGDLVLLKGKITEPETFDTKSGNSFDYKSFLAKDSIHFVSYYPEVVIVGTGQGGILRPVLYFIKETFLQRLALAFEEPKNSLLAGLILGVKHGMGEELNELFRRSGLVHIIVLSGFNMTLVAFFVRRIFLSLGRKTSGYFSIVSIILFTILSGASSTSIRAAIMAILFIISEMVGRDYNIKRSLFFAAFVMVLFNPKIVAYDPSFSLSFLATIGLVYFSPWLEKKLKFLPERLSIRAIVSATLSTQLFVLPVLVAMSGEISIISPITNLLVLPFVPVGMLLGFISGLLMFVSEIVAWPFIMITDAVLAFIIKVATLGGSMNFATVSIPEIFVPIFQVILLLSCTLYIFKNPQKVI